MRFSRFLCLVLAALMLLSLCEVFACAEGEDFSAAEPSSAESSKSPGEAERGFSFFIVGGFLLLGCLAFWYIAVRRRKRANDYRYYR